MRRCMIHRIQRSSRGPRASRDIAWQTQDREARELLLRWRIRTAPAVQHGIFAEDPRVGLLEGWIVAAQQHNRFRSPEVQAMLAGRDSGATG